MCKILFLLLLLGLTLAHRNESVESETVDSVAPPPSGKSFFIFGAIFRKFRQRLLGYRDPVPPFAGPAFPLYGYYNCPAYGCNPAVNYNPAPYENPNYYHYAAPLPPPPPSVINAYNPNIPYAVTPQQQQQTQTAQQQSNVVIYQPGQQQQGYYPQYLPPQAGMPLPLPPPRPAYPVNNYGSYLPTGPAVSPPLAPSYGRPGPAYGPSGTPIGPGSCGPPPYPCSVGG